MPPPPEELLTASDAAPLLGMDPSNVRRLTRAGVLVAAAVTISQARPISLYRRADVLALAAKRARPQRLPTRTEVKAAAELRSKPGQHSKRGRKGEARR
jgi:hypothetical protein